jgi:hypothetical protein
MCFFQYQKALPTRRQSALLPTYLRYRSILKSLPSEWCGACGNGREGRSRELHGVLAAYLAGRGDGHGRACSAASSPDSWLPGNNMLCSVYPGASPTQHKLHTD